MTGSAGVTAAQAAPAPTTAVIVQLESPADVGPMTSEAVHIGGKVKHVYARVLDGFAAELPAQAVDALQRNPRVKSVTPDAATRGSDTQAAPPWGLDRIDQRDVALHSGYSYDTTGAGVTVYVVDSGVSFSHTDFGGRVSTGYDFVDDDKDASDCNGHGTHVAGTVLGSTYGVAKQARAVSLRVFGCTGAGRFSDTIAAFEYAVADHRGPAVINYSGGGSAFALMDDAVARATAAGVTVVVAAGNDSKDACTTSPARAPSAITVGASDSADARASFSNYGSCVDLFAPGVGVLSSTMTSDTSSGFMSGTSMATPHAAGVAARYLQAHPAASPAEVTKAITSTATTGIVKNSLSAQNHLLYVKPPALGLPGAPTSVAVTPASSTSATLAWAPPTSTGGSTITGYRLARDGGTAGGTPWSGTATATERSRTFTGLTPGATYTLSVSAINAQGPDRPPP